MYDNRPEETKYIYTDNDATGQPLDGNHLKSVTSPPARRPQ
jgi:hypothetical protein